MAMKRLQKWLGVLVVLSLASMAVLRATYWTTRVTEANFAKIREGMTRQEVEAILGKPLSMELPYPNDHRPARVGITYNRDQGFWRTSLDQFVIDIERKRGTVCRTYIFEGGPDKRGVWQRIEDEFREAVAQIRGESP
jgi:hypothetical protein